MWLGFALKQMSAEFGPNETRIVRHSTRHFYFHWTFMAGCRLSRHLSCDDTIEAIRRPQPVAGEKWKPQKFILAHKINSHLAIHWSRTFSIEFSCFCPWWKVIGGCGRSRKLFLNSFTWCAQTHKRLWNADRTGAIRTTKNAFSSSLQATCVYAYLMVPVWKCSWILRNQSSKHVLFILTLSARKFDFKQICEWICFLDANNAKFLAINLRNFAQLISFHFWLWNYSSFLTRLICDLN